jgi:hypothetical protein
LTCLSSILLTVLAFRSSRFFGSIVKKQSFVAVFAYIIYGHVLLNLGVGIWLIWFVLHAANKDIVEGCLDSGKDQFGRECKSDLNLVKGVVVGFTVFVLLTELCQCITVTDFKTGSFILLLFDCLDCALIVARYLHNLKAQKRQDRASRSEDFNLLPQQGKGIEESSPSDFNPYREVESPGPHPDAEQGYGGGRWTHEHIADAEKQRIRELERDRPSPSYAEVIHDEQGEGGHARPSMEDEGLPGYDPEHEAPYVPAEKNVL